MLQYLVAHNDAKDTAHGIMQWWLIGAEARLRVIDLNTALEDLVARGWITATTVGHGPTLYGLDRTRLHEIQEYLARTG